jgi:anti-anti-sigma factor
MDFILETEEKKPYYLLKIKGKFSIINADEVLKKGLQAITAGYKQLVFDLSETTFIDSKGIGVLTSLHKQLLEKGGAVLLASLPDRISRLLESCGLLKMFKKVETADNAKQAAPLVLEQENRGFYVLFRIPGTLDMHCLNPIKEAFTRILADNCRHVVFDFAKTRAVSSVGIGLILNMHKELIKKQGSVHLVNMAPDVQSVFDATQVLNVIPSYKTMDEINAKLII